MSASATPDNTDLLRLFYKQRESHRHGQGGTALCLIILIQALAGCRGILPCPGGLAFSHYWRLKEIRHIPPAVEGRRVTGGDEVVLDVSRLALWKDSALGGGHVRSGRVCLAWMSGIGCRQAIPDAGGAGAVPLDATAAAVCASRGPL